MRIPTPFKVAPQELAQRDGVGAGSSKDGGVERKLLTRIISARYNAKKPTVFTANLSQSELERVLGERAYDRMRHSYLWVIFDGVSYRQKEERGRVMGVMASIRE